MDPRGPAEVGAEAPGRAHPADGEEPTELLLDRFLPRYDLAVVHAAVFRAPPEESLRALRQLDLGSHPAFRALFAARALPGRITGHDGERQRSFRIDDMVTPGFGWVVLGEATGTEIVLGHVGRPRRAAPGAAPSPASVPPEEFAAFDRPGFAKIALSLRADRRGSSSSILTAETRVALTDRASLRRFRRYWLLVGPFSDLLRRTALRMLARELHRPRVEGDIVIERPVEEVFDTVADERLEPRYNSDVLGVEKTTDGPIGVGTRFRALHRAIGRPVGMSTVITEYQRPSRVAIATTMAWADVEGWLTCEPVREGTRLSWSWTVRPKGPFRLLTPLLPRLTRREEDAVWRGLKRMLEERRPGSGA